MGAQGSYNGLKVDALDAPSRHQDAIDRPKDAPEMAQDAPGTPQIRPRRPRQDARRPDTPQDALDTQILANPRES